MPRVSTASYALQNANYNVMALLDSSGAVLERYEYSPYGQRTVYFSPGSNDPLAMAPTLRSRRLTVAGVDQPYGRNDFGHQGLMHEHPDDLVYNRARTLHTRLGRFAQRDPEEYSDGLCLFLFVAATPVVKQDPSGRKSQGKDCADACRSYEGTAVWGSCMEACNSQGGPDGGFDDQGPVKPGPPPSYPSLPPVLGVGIDSIFDVGPFDTWHGGVVLPNEHGDVNLPYLMPGMPGNAIDALRHCYWSCRLTQDLGAEQAKEITDNYEAWGVGTPAQNQQDYANNSHGRDCGGIKPASNGCKKSKEVDKRNHCISCCRQKWFDGTLSRGNP